VAVDRLIPLVTTNLVLAEIHRLTLFRAGREPALRALELIDKSASVKVHFATSDDHSAGRQWLQRLPRPVTYTDAVSFAVIEASGCTHVLGFDDDFVAAGFELWRG
jgi:predicted nucleic acid-binding protein